MWLGVKGCSPVGSTSVLLRAFFLVVDFAVLAKSQMCTCFSCLAPPGWMLVHLKFHWSPYVPLTFPSLLLFVSLSFFLSIHLVEWFPSHVFQTLFPLPTVLGMTSWLQTSKTPFLFFFCLCVLVIFCDWLLRELLACVNTMIWLVTKDPHRSICLFFRSPCQYLHTNIFESLMSSPSADFRAWGKGHWITSYLGFLCDIINKLTESRESLKVFSFNDPFVPSCCYPIRKLAKHFFGFHHSHSRL